MLGLLDSLREKSAQAEGSVSVQAEEADTQTVANELNTSCCL